MIISMGLIMRDNKSKILLPPGETALFCSQVALILKAGIPLYEGIESLSESARDNKANEALKRISEVVIETGSIYQAVKKAEFFPVYMVNMIHIGEETGNLEDVMNSLATYYEREDKVKKTIKSAITYPILLIAMMAAVISLLVTQVIPIFEEVFNNLGTDMPASAKTILKLGLTVGNLSFVIIGIIILIAMITYFLSKLGFYEQIANMLNKFYIIKRLNKKISAGRFSAVLSMMLSSGYSLEKALKISPDIITDKSAKEKIRKCEEYINEGKTFPYALEEIKIFKPLESRMISVGYKAGQLDTVMSKLTKVYEEEVDEEITKIVSFIEPVIVAILSIIIGGILLSVMLPLASIMSSIG